MNCQELLHILEKGEDSRHQFKEKFNSIDNLTVEISAFANTDGGEIIIGGSNDGKLTGLSKKDVDRFNQWIANATTHKIDKPIFAKTKILICEGKRILIVHVPQGLNKPYVVNRTDVWGKVGADKRWAPIEEVLRLAQTSGLVYADEMETSAIFDDFDLEFFEKRYQKFYQKELGQLDVPVSKVIE
ncbi:MAG: ATP-binding protein [candidate division KSB1 bacterium]|nr:ATP-binding protein [candidate division KSB1 bacterium]